MNEFNQGKESQESKVQINWHRQDIEQRFGFSGAKFTRVNGWFTAIVAAVMTVVFYLCLIPVQHTPFAKMFTERGNIPYAIVYFSAWAVAIIGVKWQKIRLQRKSLDLEIVPPEVDFVLSTSTVDQVVNNMQLAVDDPRRFVLLNRINVALSNLRNLGRVSDVDEILHSQADLDESGMETSYSLLRGFVWAIPVLGFIGTVLGLSVAIGGFGEVLAQATEVSELTSSLQTVTGGLSTAFETTLAALVCALCVQILITFLKKSEEEFLDECAEYCQRNIVGRLRLMPFETDGTEP